MPYRYACLGFALFALGCGGNKLAPVKGRLVYPDGSPVTKMANGQVIFEPEDPDAGNVSSVGTIDAQGQFVLTTNKPNDGATVGKNRVVVNQNIPDANKPPPRVLLEKYGAFDTSGIVLDVVPGQNDFTITVEPYKK